MPVNTLSVGAAVTPTVIHTYISHYLNRRPLAQKPTAHISYHEGLELIRRFLHYASFNTVDELQAFTSQWVPVPRWVHVKVVDIAGDLLAKSASLINEQLGPAGITAVGGQSWWQWRRDGSGLQAEWVEMRKDHDARKQLNMPKGDRIMLYVHGGAYFFGSVDEHRYQLQRHARKLKARVLAPKYRLSPQFPFPCGLQDCLAAYLYLLEQEHDPNTIVLAGDSAGGGMVLSMLVTLRDQRIALPAGAILISPWVDLTHSFPSLSGDGKMDYIPAHGFMQKPSISWPPPNADDILQFERARDGHPAPEEREAQKEAKAERVRGYSVRSTHQPDADALLNGSSNVSHDATGHGSDMWVSSNCKYSVGPKSTLSVQLDSEQRVEIKDQIQMYAPNHLLTHPLVSPALQPTLGGLPPLLIQTGGGELLRDEQIYLAHKAAHPAEYLPPPSNNQTVEDIEAQALKYRPTNVQLQVWDDLCHVGPTLSFTRPAKYMYRSIAQFGAWTLARAQKKSIDIVDDDDISFISTDSSNPSGSKEDVAREEADQAASASNGTSEHRPKETEKRTVGKAGDPLPYFQQHMIRQRVDRHGRIYPLAAKEDLIALNLPREDVGVPKTGPVSKWMKAQAQWNSKFAKQKIKIQKQRIKDMEKGFEGFDGEIPPPTALAGRRVKGMKAEKAPKRSWGMSMWSGWGMKHDQATMRREAQADQGGSNEAPERSRPVDPPATSTDSANDTNPQGTERSRSSKMKIPSFGRSRSHHSAVTDRGQASSMGEVSKLESLVPIHGSAEATRIALEQEKSNMNILTANDGAGDEAITPGLSFPGIIISDHPNAPVTLIPATDGSSTRPTKGGIAYPFSLKVDGAVGHSRNASMLTLDSVSVATPPAVESVEHEKRLGVKSKVVESVRPSAVGHDSTISTMAEKENEVLYTNGPGAGLFSSGAKPDDVEGAEKLERPPVERFETAVENLSTIAGKVAKG